MSDAIDLNDRVRSRRPAVADDDPDAADDCGGYGLLRGVRERAVMLDVRLKTGGREAFAYALLERVSYDPSVGLTLRFHGVAVTLVGRNLARVGDAGVSLLDLLHRHRVAWVREVEEVRTWLTAADATVVTKVEIVAGR